MRLGSAFGLDGHEGVAADEVAFIELEPAREAGFEDVDVLRDFVAVEAHAGFEAEGVARAEAAGANAELCARVEESVPHVHGGGLVGRDVELEAVFAGIAGAGDDHIGDAGNCAPGEPVIFDGGEIELGELGESLERARALQGELRVVGGVVAQMNAGKAANLAVDPGEVFILGAGVDDQQIVVGAEAVDEDVVDEGARGCEQRGVVRLAIFELRGVVHGDVLDGGERAGAAELDFAHVADVEEADAGAHGHVLGNKAAAGAWVFDRHVPAAEVDHFGFEGAMRGVECGFFERLGGGGNKIGHGDSFGERGLHPLST